MIPKHLQDNEICEENDLLQELKDSIIDTSSEYQQVDSYYAELIAFINQTENDKYSVEGEKKWSHIRACIARERDAVLEICNQ